MDKPTKEQKENLLAKADVLKDDLTATGFGSPTATIDPDDDNKVTYEVDDPTMPGRRMQYTTFVVGPPHPETGDRKTAEEMLDSGETKARLEDMAIRRGFANKRAEMLTFVLGGSVIPGK